MIEYDKLVRDRIPEIIRASGRPCDCETLTDEEFLVRAERKLDEELAEFHESRDVSELADLIEVIYAVAAALGADRDGLERIRARKADERGAFNGKILLKRVYGAGE